MENVKLITVSELGKTFIKTRNGAVVLFELAVVRQYPKKNKVKRK